MSLPEPCKEYNDVGAIIIGGTNDKQQSQPPFLTPKRKRRMNFGWSHKKKKAGKDDSIQQEQQKEELEQSTTPMVPAPRIVMKKMELAEWKNWYRTPESLQDYLRQQANDPNGLLEDFYQTLAQLMFHMFDSSFYDICYLNHYEWEMCIDENQSAEFDFERGSILRLRILDCNGKSQPYISIAKSTFGGLGVFTARDFPQGALLGLYQGPRVWEADWVGTEAPSDEFLASQGVKSSPCLCSIRDNQGRMAVYAPERIPPTDVAQPLYLGMHFMKGVEEKGVDGTPNCEIVEDGGVVAHFALPENTELICGVLPED